MLFNICFAAFVLVCGVALVCEAKGLSGHHPFWLATLAVSTGLIPVALCLTVVAAVLGK